jgi:hypothetical protein
MEEKFVSDLQVSNLGNSENPDEALQRKVQVSQPSTQWYLIGIRWAARKSNHTDTGYYSVYVIFLLAW